MAPVPRPAKTKLSPSKSSRQSTILSFFNKIPSLLSSGEDTPSRGSTTPSSCDTTPASYMTAATSVSHYASDGPSRENETPSRPQRGLVEMPYLGLKTEPAEVDDMEVEREGTDEPKQEREAMGALKQEPMDEPDQPDQPDQPPKAPTRRYRSAREAPDTIKEQTQILFEENIYNLALQDLQVNLFSQSHLGDRPWWVAPPTHIALLGTLVIHPLHTTRGREDGRNQKMVSVRAHQYLLDVVRSVGPINGHFKTAFAFRDRCSRADKRRRHLDDVEDADADDQLTTPLANSDSLWNRVPDFWTMLGWAFHCAASYPERWVHWKLWLELLLEVLERDLKERIALDEERRERTYPMLNDSMMRSYIGDHQLGHIMHVLFAYIDQGSHSYTEIWPNETRTAKEARSTPPSNKRKWDTRVDLHNNDFGEWFESEEDEEYLDESEDVQDTSTTSTPKKRRGKGWGRPTKKKRPLPLVEHPLLEETIAIRLRIFALVSELCFKLPDGDVQFDIASLYETFAGYIRSLTLDVFPHFVSSEMQVLPSIYVTLMRHLLTYLLPPGAPEPCDVDKETDAKGFISAVMMEQCYLPFATNSVVADNAKLATVLRALFAFLLEDETTAELGRDLSSNTREAIMAGITAREKKSKMSKEEAPMAGWDADRTMDLVQKDPYAAASVLRSAHAYFRLLLEDQYDMDLETLAGKDNLGGDDTMGRA